jgi:hypothetical protein
MPMPACFRPDSGRCWRGPKEERRADWECAPQEGLTAGQVVRNEE